LPGESVAEAVAAGAETKRSDPGTGALPVMEQVKLEANRRGVELVILPTADATELLKDRAADTNAILHVTC
jgi:hypothetical protein